MPPAKTISDYLLGKIWSVSGQFMYINAPENVVVIDVGRQMSLRSSTPDCESIAWHARQWP